MEESAEFTAGAGGQSPLPALCEAADGAEYLLNGWDGYYGWYGWDGYYGWYGWDGWDGYYGWDGWDGWDGWTCGYPFLF